jgi:uncharacterized protein
MVNKDISYLNPYPIEGDFITFQNNWEFEIKDFHQPRDKTVAYLRYFSEKFENAKGRTKNQTNINDSASEKSDPAEKYEHKYTKIYEIKDRFKFLKNNYPSLIFKHPNYYFDMQAVSNDSIAHHYRPEVFLNDLLCSKREIKNPILLKAVEFCKFLSEGSDVSLSYFGITGSLLLNLSTSSSDIDIIVYGFGNSLKVRETLRKVFELQNEDSELLKYNLKEFKELYKFRAKGSPISFYEFLNVEIRKLHQGKYKNIDYFIRFLEHENRESYKELNQFNTRKIINLGRITVNGQVHGDQYWWTTPARVKITDIYIKKFVPHSSLSKTILEDYNLKLTDIVQTFTLRGRFIENVRLLEFFEANGTLELIVSQKNRPYLQLNFALDPSDYFICK